MSESKNKQTFRKSSLPKKCKLSINKGDKLDSPFFKKSSLLVDRDKFRVLKPSAGSQMLPNAAPPPRPLVPDITPQLKNLFMDKQVSKIKN